jgi:two-component system NtrC family sensor kinase/two-component system sensor histidine kinase AtoS
MIDKNLIESLDSKDRKIVLQSLQSLIEQTYSVESEYKALNTSYNSLKGLIEQIIEVLPNALWVIGKQGDVFLQNSEAKALDTHLSLFMNANEDDELFVDERYFLINKRSHSEKLIISATDITSHKRKDRLAFMGQMAAHLAHEIRNPVGSISLLIPTLLKHADAKSKPVIEEIKRAIIRVERIIKSTLLYSKGVSAKIKTFESRTLEQHLQNAVHYYGYEKNIDFVYAFEQKSLQGDFDLLSLMLQNFVFNAIDAIEEDDENESGSVKIVLADNCFKIYDSGVAIKNPEELFVAFNTTKTKGNGLGLVLAKQIANAHGGDIAFVQEPKHFIITLGESL